MGKFLAFDIGEKRIGVAHSDDSGSFPFPLNTLKVDENIEAEVDKLIKEENPEKIIIGLPRNMDGTLGFQAERVKEFVSKHLTNYEHIIDFEDESATTLEAEKLIKLEGKDPIKNKGLVDMYAARVILESYIRRQS